LERLYDLTCDRDSLVDLESAALDPIGERRAFDELQHERVNPARVLETVNGRDIRVVERREDLRFAFEARESIRIARKRGRQDLDGHVAIQFRIARAIDLAHSADTQQAVDPKDADLRSDSQHLHYRRVITSGTIE